MFESCQKETTASKAGRTPTPAAARAKWGQLETFRNEPTPSGSPMSKRYRSWANKANANTIPERRPVGRSVGCIIIAASLPLEPFFCISLSLSLSSFLSSSFNWPHDITQWKTMPHFFLSISFSFVSFFLLEFLSLFLFFLPSLYLILQCKCQNICLNTGFLLLLFLLPLSSSSL